MAALEISGNNLSALDNEAGGHRIQRIPPTERRGRVHTSTVTVAVVDPSQPVDATVDDADIKIEWFSGTGKGGQHRNKHQNCCRLTHLPTGIVQTATGRERNANLANAKRALTEALVTRKNSHIAHQTNANRRAQVGSGMRGDKRRTYRFRDDRVVDHATGKQATCSQAMRGEFERLWD